MVPGRYGPLTPLEKKFEERCNELLYKHFQTKPAEAKKKFEEADKMHKYQVSNHSESSCSKLVGRLLRNFMSNWTPR